MDLERAGADAAQLEDVGDQPFEALGLVVDGVEQLGAVGGVEVEVGRAQGRRRRLDRRQRRAEVVGDRRQEAGAGPPDLGVDPGVAGLGLEAQAVDGGGQPGDQRLQQRAVRRGQRVLPAGDRLHLERGRSARSSTRPGVPGPVAVVVQSGPAQRARREPEQRDQRLGRAGDDRVGILARHEPGGEVEPDLCLPLALLGGAAQAV